MKKTFDSIKKIIIRNKKYLLFYIFLFVGILLTLYVEYKFQYAQFKWLGWRVSIICGAVVQYGSIPKKIRNKYKSLIIKLLVLIVFLYIINFLANSINVYHLDRFQTVNNFCESNITACKVLSDSFYKFKLYRFVSLTSYFFFYIIFSLIGFVFSEKIYDRSYKIWQKIPKVKLKYTWAFYFLITYLIFQQLVSVFSSISRKTVKIIGTMTLPFEERWEPAMGGRFSFGWIDTYSNFIKAQVPKDAMLLIPNQTAPWEMEGNEFYFRWFVYPIRMTQMFESTEIPKETDYVLISYGVFGYHKEVFPDFKIEKEKIDKIILVDQETLAEQEITNESFDPENYKNKWGIIKLR